ncbi:MAG: DUF4145 domain-containing protein [Hydrogenophaga sp.]|nr:DUF4145 domain-containing protein [Hydrogenophaga sp.]
MSELVADCPRCGAKRITFEIGSPLYVGREHGWRSHHEVFCVCRACKRSTVFVLALEDAEIASRTDDPKFWAQAVVMNRFFEVTGYVSNKDRGASDPPEALPSRVGAAFSEGSKCVAVDCNNAAAAMFRLALDLATEPLLPAEGDSDPPQKVRRDLGLRLRWLFDKGRLPADLRALSDCVREDGNDGAHRGNVTAEDAADIQDFCFELLDRLFSEPARLVAAEARRVARRSEAKSR